MFALAFAAFISNILHNVVIKAGTLLFRERVTEGLPLETLSRFPLRTFPSLVSAFFVGGAFRCLCGEPIVNLPVLLKLPLYDEKAGQRFPFRFVAMVLGLCANLLGSGAAARAFAKGWLPEHLDVCHCFVEAPNPQPDRRPSVAGNDTTALVSQKDAEPSSAACNTDSQTATAQERRSSIRPGAPRDARSRRMSVASGAPEAPRKTSLRPSGAIPDKQAVDTETAATATTTKTSRKSYRSTGARRAKKRHRKPV
ncbi:hypothetical protein HPB48_026772 [Haemaphysalis longicornis]|uniref:Uncharacterized protein n=1 Tax=Haemaphysalis longicornis TaxID=44386 RepID=A0A9J6H1Z1_HAELO|nr:hypothetical protein HPB48_026772 [Haemaphysalis longicornis]